MVIPTVTPAVASTVDATAAPARGVSYGPDLMGSDGEFDAALTGWTKGGGTPDWVGAESPPSSGNYVALIVGDVSTGARTLTKTLTGLTNGAIYRIDVNGTMGIGLQIDFEAEGGTAISIDGLTDYTRSGEFTAVGTSADIVITTAANGTYLDNVNWITVREKLS